MDASTQLGRYRLGEQIGSGGMAEVFRGELSGAEGFSRPVAIKRVRARLVGDTATASGFIDEARLAQRLQHGNIVQTYDLGIDAGTPYIVMEFVDGLSLAEVIKHNHAWNHRLGLATSLFVIEAVANALDYAHGLSDADGNSDGVVHRDVNPRNILLSKDGIVKLTDFGIAKGMNMKPRTLPGRVKGTLGYLSPEQAYGGIIGPPTDQFATGVVLYQLLAGRNPLAGAKKIKEYRKMLDEGLPRLEAPDVDDELRSIVHRATASKMDARFTSMSEFRQTLEAWRVARGIRTSLDGVREIVRSYRSNRAPSSAARTGPAVAPAVATVRKVPVAKLDSALLAQLGGNAQERRDTRMIPQAEAVPTTTRGHGRRWVAVAAALLAVAVLVVVVVLSGGDDPKEAGTSAGQGNADSDEPATLENPTAAEQAANAKQVFEEAARAKEAASDDERLALADPSDLIVDDRVEPGVDQTAKDKRDKTAKDKRDKRDKRAKDKKDKRDQAAKDKREQAAKNKREQAAKDKRDQAAKDKRDQAAKDKPQKARTATIRVNVLPYAEVSLNGRGKGRTPKTLRVVPGPHRIRLHNPDTGKSTTKSITVGDGETKSITSW